MARSEKVVSRYGAAAASKNSTIAACGDPVKVYSAWHPYTDMLRSDLLRELIWLNLVICSVITDVILSQKHNT